MRKRSIGSAAFVWHSSLIHQFPTMTYRRGVSPQIRVALNVSQKVGTFDMLLKTVIIRKQAHQRFVLFVFSTWLHGLDSERNFVCLHRGEACMCAEDYPKCLVATLIFMS